MVGSYLCLAWFYFYFLNFNADKQCFMFFISPWVSLLVTGRYEILLK